MLERYFKLSAHGTTVRTEVMAGVTTFLTMAYIIFVNPDILSAAGMPKESVFVATCLAAAIGSAIMGLYANYPIALAPPGSTVRPQKHRFLKVFRRSRAGLRPVF